MQPVGQLESMAGQMAGDVRSLLMVGKSPFYLKWTGSKNDALAATIDCSHWLLMLRWNNKKQDRRAGQSDRQTASPPEAHAPGGSMKIEGK